MRIRRVGEHAVIEKGSTLLLFNTIDSGLYKIKPITEKLFNLVQKHGIETAKKLMKEGDVEDIAEEKITELTENGFLDQEPDFTPPTTFPITGMSLNVSHDCNLNCRYCYGGGGTYVGEKSYMNKEIGETSIDRLLGWSEDCERIYLNFFGGEPLLNFSLIQHLVNYGNKKAELEGKRIKYSITSNCTLLTEKIIKFLNDHNINVLASMDGPKPIQNTNRPFKNGGGSYDTIASNVQKLFSTRKTVTARATLTRDCISLNTIINGLRSVGFKYIHIEPVTADNTCSFALSEEDFETLKKEYENVGKIFMDSVLRGDPIGFSNILRMIHRIYNSVIRHYPCGAGKTTFCKIMNGLVIPSSGNLYIDGYETIEDHNEISKRMVTVFGGEREMWGLFSWRVPVEKNLRYIAELWKVPSDCVNERIDYALDILNLEDKRTEWYQKLSAGMKQKVHLALAFIVQPKIIVLDEPTIRLDVPTKRHVHKVIQKELCATLGSTVLLTTHDMHEAETLCDRVAILNTTIESIDKPENIKELSKQYEIMELKLKESNTALKTALKPFVMRIEDRYHNGKWYMKIFFEDKHTNLPRILEVVKDAVDDIRMRTPSLEDAFVYLVRDDDH